LGDIDPSISAVWRTILSNDADWLIRQILTFTMTRAAVVEALNRSARNVRELAFQTLLRNRVQRGGIMAPGASLVKNGEDGRGVASRWYPQTLAKRIADIVDMRARLQFIEGDGFEIIQKHLRRQTAAFFIDPPYTAGGKCAGRRLYTYNDVDHERLFALMAKARGPVMMTYDDDAYVRQLAQRHRFQVEAVPMKNTHHSVVHELVISNTGSCLDLARETIRPPPGQSPE
jgi:DNA adenine methylase